eukprot:scaffold25685_cov127-Cylindrotheca_fusiformis.AAC.3
MKKERLGINSSILAEKIPKTLKNPKISYSIRMTEHMSGTLTAPNITAVCIRITTRLANHLYIVAIITPYPRDQKRNSTQDSTHPRKNTTTKCKTLRFSRPILNKTVKKCGRQTTIGQDRRDPSVAF